VLCSGCYQSQRGQDSTSKIQCSKQATENELQDLLLSVGMQTWKEKRHDRLSIPVARSRQAGNVNEVHHVLPTAAVVNACRGLFLGLGTRLFSCLSCSIRCRPAQNDVETRDVSHVFSRCTQGAVWVTSPDVSCPFPFLLGMDLAVKSSAAAEKRAFKSQSTRLEALQDMSKEDLEKERAEKKGDDDAQNVRSTVMARSSDTKFGLAGEFCRANCRAL
jgi:hypothetical protein